MSDISSIKTAMQTLETGLRDTARQEAYFDALKRAADERNAAVDKLEEKLAVSSAVAAAASGTPEEAKAMASKIRAKAMRAAVDGADAGALESMVRDMERLAKLAEENRAREKNGGKDVSAAAIPVLAAIAKS
ncbi:MAG: hypothetical protein IT566_15205 [Rhodospirillaceae bacterium]|nr:hypothetical protein [Rhodospirillaceae bacterium]